jgi:hypothetical protein
LSELRELSRARREDSRERRRASIDTRGLFFVSRELSRESPKLSRDLRGVSGRFIKSSRVSINSFRILVESSREPHRAFCRSPKRPGGSKKYLGGVARKVTRVEMEDHPRTRWSIRSRAAP